MPIGKQVVGIHSRYFRPAEVDLLIGDATKAKTQLGWKPKYDLLALVDEPAMVGLRCFSTCAFGGGTNEVDNRSESFRGPCLGTDRLGISAGRSRRRF